MTPYNLSMFDLKIANKRTYVFYTCQQFQYFKIFNNFKSFHTRLPSMALEFMKQKLNL